MYYRLAHKVDGIVAPNIRLVLHTSEEWVEITVSTYNIFIGGYTIHYNTCSNNYHSYISYIACIKIINIPRNENHRSKR